MECPGSEERKGLYRSRSRGCVSVAGIPFIEIGKQLVKIIDIDGVLSKLACIGGGISHESIAI